MRCVVPNCDHKLSTTLPGVTYHTFPTEPSLRVAWLDALHMADFELQKHSAVCSRHFLQQDLLMTSTGLRTVRAGAVPSGGVKVCRICFASNCKLYQMTEYNIFSNAYETLTGLSIKNDDNLPTYLCIDCSHQLLNCARFRTTSLRAHSTLLNIVKSYGYVTLELIHSFKGIHSRLNLNSDHNCDSTVDYRVDHSNFYANNITNVTAQPCDVFIKNNHGTENVTNDNKVCTHSLPENVAIATIKLEKDPIDSNTFSAVNVTNDNTVCTLSLPQDDAIDNIKVETDPNDPNNLGAVNVTNDNTVFISSWTENNAIDKIKVEKDPVDGNNLIAVNVTNDNTVHISTWPKDVAIDTIKVEKDPIDRNNLSALNVTNHNMVYTSSLPEYHAIDNIKVEIDDTDLVCTAGVAENDAVDYRNKNYWMINQDIGNEQLSIDYTENEDGIVDEDYSSGDYPLTKAVLKPNRSVTGLRQVTKVPKKTVLAKIDTCRNPKADGGLLLNDTLSCNVCSYQTHNGRHFCSHLKAHAASKSYACNVCNFITVHSSSLTSHLKIHSGVKVDLLKVRSKTYKGKPDVTKHSQTHSSEILYSCDICKKSFNRKTYLKKHIRTHSGEKPYSCKVCNKAFTEKGSLKIHLRTHSGEKPYSCKVCNKAFTHKGHVQIHLRTHSGEKPYSCEICNKAFTEKGSLKIHLRTHSGEKPYSCKVCSKEFTYKGHLKIHFRTHSGEKPFSCEVCNKAFTEKGNLKKHLRTHSGEKNVFM